MGRAWGWIVIALLAAGMAGGCGGADSPARVDWDLSRSHTPRDVAWPRPGVSSVSLNPVGSVRIALPGGKAFAAASGIRDINMSTLGGTGDVSDIHITSEPLSTDAAHELALRWARHWSLRTDKIAEWYSERQAGKRQEEEDLASRVEFGGERLEGPDAPIPGLSILSSRRDDRPSVVQFSLYWPEPGEEVATEATTPLPSF